MVWNIFSAASGVLNVIQWIQQQLGLSKFGLRNQQFEAIKASLLQLNAMCNDAVGKGDASKPAAMMRFISDVAHMAKTAEHQANIALGNLQVVRKDPPSWLRRILGYIFPLTRI